MQHCSSIWLMAEGYWEWAWICQYSSPYILPHHTCRGVGMAICCTTGPLKPLSLFCNTGMKRRCQQNWRSKLQQWRKRREKWSQRPWLGRSIFASRKWQVAPGGQKASSRQTHFSMCYSCISLNPCPYKDSGHVKFVQWSLLALIFVWTIIFICLQTSFLGQQKGAVARTESGLRIVSGTSICQEVSISSFAQNMWWAPCLY